MPGDVSRNLPAAGLDDGEYETIRAAGLAALGATCVLCRGPGTVHHMPSDRPDFWLCADCDD